MKRGLLLGAVAGVIAVTGIIMNGYCFSDKALYKQRSKENVVRYENDWNGAQGYLKLLRANAITGEIDPEDVLAARAQANSLMRKKSSTIGLTWENLGPNNVGGRTRCILVDNNDPNTLFVGSVSGGLFKSTTNGSSWQQVNDFESNLAVVSLAQSSDGTIYYGTGEGLYYGDRGTGTGGILGGGMFKSTDGGNTFQVMPSTIPTANNTGSEFASIGKIEIDPNNPQRIYAATNLGLRRSDDGGETWSNPFSLSFNPALDMAINSQGGVWVKQGSFLYFSATGDDGSFNSVDAGVGASRARVAVAPTDDNYVYVAIMQGSGTSQQFKEVRQSKDGGVTWQIIGEQTATLDPHGSQGQFNNALAVSPLDKERIIVGGVQLWEWSTTNGWLRIATTVGASTGSLFYVHADNHEITFHPTRPNEIYIGNDGGVFKSSDGGVTWIPLSQEYVSSQFYSFGVGYDGALLGGTQDNGTILVSPKSFLPRSGVRTNAIDYDGSLKDGDGGYAEISHLNPLMAFKEMQYGVLGRTADSGESFSSFYDFSRMDPANYSRTGTNENAFASFVAPFRLWEDLDDPLSTDSVQFAADSAISNLGFGSGARSYQGTLNIEQPTTQFVKEGFVISAGNQLVTSTSNVTVGDTSVTLTGDGTGYFNFVNGNFEVTFTNAVISEIKAKGATGYAAGVKLFLESVTNSLPLEYTLTDSLMPNDVVMVQDPVQAMFVMGLGAYNITGSADGNTKGGIWMTREVISSPLLEPKWNHISKLTSGDIPISMEISPDGNTVYVGTSNGRLYKITNLVNARDSASTDVDDYYIKGSIDRPNTSVVETSIMRTFNQVVTSIAINSQNLNQVVVTLGQYGSSNYVYRTDNALSATPTFVSIMGDLPEQPFYSATFNYNDPTGTQLILGSEDGIYTTENVNAASVSYTKENTGMANVPVFSMRQPRTVRYDLLASDDFEGAIYIGTHGRGYFKTSSTSDYIGIDEQRIKNPITAAEVALEIYPNPAISETMVKLTLENRSDIKVVVRDLSGKQVKMVSLKAVDTNVDGVPLNVSSLKNGTYIVSLQVNNTVKTSKMVVLH